MLLLWDVEFDLNMQLELELQRRIYNKGYINNMCAFNLG